MVRPLTFGGKEINDFWDQIRNPQILSFQNLFPEVVYLFPIKSYSKNDKLISCKPKMVNLYVTVRPLTFDRKKINEFWEQIWNPQILSFQNLFPEVIYLAPIQSYS